MTTKFSSRSFFILTLLTLTGVSGCSQPPQKPLAVTQPSVEIADKTDTSAWKQDTLGKGFVFAYPPTLNYLSGGNVKTGSFSWITGEQPEEIYFEILDLKISTTREKMYDETVKSFTMDDFYFPAETISIAEITGQKFRIREDLNDGIARTAVVFYNTKGVYLISDYQEVKNDALFDAFVGTFKKE